MRIIGRVALAILAIGFGLGVYAYLTLPNVRVLRTMNPETTAFMRIRAQEQADHGRTLKRVQKWVPYSRISPHLVRAVLVAEDPKFWNHDGLDYEQIKESIEINLERRELARGASTITQQLAKNLYLSPSKNPIRKLRELLIARRLEAELSKRRILEVYLNVIEWGDGIYGAEAAARTYFRVPAAALSVEQSALLAGAIVNPRLLTPERPTAHLRWRQRLILRRMGAVKPPEAEPAEAVVPASRPPLDLVPPLPDAPVAPPALPGEVVPIGTPPVKTPGGGGSS